MMAREGNLGKWVVVLMLVVGASRRHDSDGGREVKRGRVRDRLGRGGGRDEAATDEPRGRAHGGTTVTVDMKLETRSRLSLRRGRGGGQGVPRRRNGVARRSNRSRQEVRTRPGSPLPARSHNILHGESARWAGRGERGDALVVEGEHGDAGRQRHEDEGLESGLARRGVGRHVAGCPLPAKR